MSEQKVHCCQCGKTIAVETETEIQIKCTGKHGNKKCGCINKIDKVTGLVTSDMPNRVTERMLTERRFYDHTKF